MKSENLFNIMNEIDDGLLLRCEQETIRHGAFRKSMRKVLPLAASFAVVIVAATWLLRPATVYVDSTTSGTTALPIVSTTTAPIHVNPDLPTAASWAVESYEQLAELWSGIGKGDNEETQDYQQYGSAFEALVEKLQGENRILIPALDGNPAPLHLKDDYKDIMVSTSNALNQPWIWYTLDANGEKVTVKTMYLPQAQIEAAQTMIVAEFLEVYYPYAPYPGNEEKHPGLTISEGEIAYDGAKVNALFTEFVDDKMEVYFLTDELLVCMLIDKDGLDSGWSSTFSFIEMPLVSE